MNIVVLISGNGSNLQAIIDACKTNKIKGTVRAVFSNKADAFGLERARQAGIATHTLIASAFDSREAYDRELIHEIDMYAPDVVVLAGFMRILSPAFVSHYAGRLLNIHPSLLPKYPGLHTHRQALENGDEEHGTSVHFVTDELDGGPVILQAKVPVFAGDTEDDITARLEQVSKLENAEFMDLMKASGEDNNAKIVAVAFEARGKKARYASPKDTGMTLTGSFGDATLDPSSYARLSRAFSNFDGIVVYPGFFGYTKEGKVATFPRGGSDITGSVVAGVFGCELYENWTDVDGIHVCDPKVVEMMKRLSFVVDEELDKQFPARRICRAEIVTKDGRKFLSDECEPRGEAHENIQVSWLQDKFRRITGPILTSAGQEKVMEMICQEEDLPIRAIVDEVNKAEYWKDRN